MVTRYIASHNTLGMMNGKVLVAAVMVVFSHNIQNSYCQTIDQNIMNAATSAENLNFLSDAGDGTDGKVTVELDMVFSMKDWEEIQRRNASDYCKHRSKRKADSLTEKRWPHATLVYELMRQDFTPEDLNNIRDAMDTWSHYTCIKFRQAGSRDKNKIRIEDGGGCSSLIGMVQGLQKLTLAKGCRMKGTILHELGHAMGFYHEHSRPDRDDYITVNTRNIHHVVLYNFDKYSSSVINTYRVTYDYLSIMHYGAKYFAKDGRRYSIITRDGNYQDKIGNREHLSFGDIKLANLMYDCARGNNCPDKRCPGEGYVGKDCKCWCPGNPVKLCEKTRGRIATRAPTTRPPVRSTPRQKTTQTVGRPYCSDKYKSCASWAKRGDCKRTKLMWEFCPRACKKCETDTGKDSSTANCEDAYDLCRLYASHGYCKHPAYRRYLESHCQKSCDTCGRASAITSVDYDECEENAANLLRSHNSLLSCLVYFLFTIFLQNVAMKWN